MKLFISYAQEQRPIAKEINASLSATGFDVFCDQTGLKTEGGTKNSDTFEEPIPCVTRRSLNPSRAFSGGPMHLRRDL